MTFTTFLTVPGPTPSADIDATQARTAVRSMLFTGTAPHFGRAEAVAARL